MSNIRIRHFHRKSNGRLLATVATRTNQDGSIMMSVARCSPLDNPSKESGRALAVARLQRFFLFKNKLLTGEELEIGREEIKRRLVADMSRPDFIEKIIRSNPFDRGNCPFGIKI